MKKGTKIAIISGVVLAGAGTYVLLNKKLRVKLGLPVTYTSDNDKQEYALEYSKFGTEVLLTAKQGQSVKGFILRDPQGVISWGVADNNNQLVLTPITNEKDLKFFQKFF